MKKRFFALIICFSLFLLVSCSGNKNSDPVNMDDLLQIHAWLLDDELEGTGNGGIRILPQRRFPVKRTETGTGFPMTA